MNRLRPATNADDDALWSILEPIFRAGDTYAIEPDISRNDALAFWKNRHEVFVCEAERQVVATYYIGPNQRGGGDHVCNCGFATAAAARGKGLARAMLEHSLDHARSRGFQGMQFNFVVSTNRRAIATWQAYGFEVVGRVPNGFRHPEHGLVEALVMFRDLRDEVG